MRKGAEYVKLMVNYSLYKQYPNLYKTEEKLNKELICVYNSKEVYVYNYQMIQRKKKKGKQKNMI